MLSYNTVAIKLLAIFHSKTGTTDDRVKISVKWEVTKSWLALKFSEMLKEMSLDKTAKF